MKSPELQHSLLITTRRMRLRPIASTDSELLETLWRDPEVVRFYRDDVHAESDLAVRSIEASLESFRTRGIGEWIAERSPQGSVIGEIGLIASDHPLYDRDVLLEEPGTAELVYALFALHRRRGYATEGVRAVLGYAHSRAGLRSVNAVVDGANSASIRVLEKAGMLIRAHTESASQELLVFGIDLRR